MRLTSCLLTFSTHVKLNLRQVIQPDSCPCSILVITMLCNMAQVLYNCYYRMLHTKSLSDIFNTIFEAG